MNSRKNPTKTIIAAVTIIILMITVLLLFYKSNHKMNNDKANGEVGIFVGFDKTMFKPGSEILYSHQNTLLIGVDDEPYYLSLSPDINPRDIKEIRDNISKLLFINFETNQRSRIVLNHLPDWLSDAKHLEYLKLSSFELDDLTLLKSLALKHLILNNISLNNRTQTLKNICEMKDLDFLVSDQALSDSDVDFLKVNRPHLKVISLMEYSKIVKSQAIKLW